MQLRLAALFCACAAPAWAGPPYLTDDPEPTDRGHWEIYNFANGTHVSGETSGEAGFDLNYGAAKDLQLTLVLPLGYDRTGGETWTGAGVVEAAAKLKVLHQREGAWTPDVAIFPRLFLPTAPSRFASRHVQLLLPVWAGKDFGAWSVFGGGGYQINPGAGNRSYWSEGLAVTRQVSERLNLGAEVFHRDADAQDGRAFTSLGLGATWKASDHWSLLAGGGPGVDHAASEGRYTFYLALKADY